MSPTQNLKKIGIVSDAHGIRGEVYIIVFAGDISWLENAKQIVLKNPVVETPQNFNLKKFKPFKKGFIASFHEITNRNQAEELKKFEVWLEQSHFISKDGEQPFLAELLDFEVSDTALGYIGNVINFSSNGLQDLLVLDKAVNQQNIEIPFVKEFIIRVDYALKKIFTELPEGLVQINEKD